MSWAPLQQPIGKRRQISSTPAASTLPATPARNERSARHAGERRQKTLLCLSHLRWDFVYQRPQHLLSRAAQDYRVLFFEEAVLDARGAAWLEMRCEEGDVDVLIPHLPPDCLGCAADDAQRRLLDAHLLDAAPSERILWYYTPMSLAFTSHLQRSLTVYDCMDELSAFRGAPPQLVDREQQLLRQADLVFTGGFSLYEAKRDRHPSVHPFPSSVDIEHFGAARASLPVPADQSAIPSPRLGYYGVIDERLDLELLAAVADARPDWHLVMVGPVVKIDPAQLPQRDNIHYLGGKPYDDLPYYLAGWDVAMMPFALNESTRFISPTKTPEYLAGGLSVVSTPITDVVRTYGDTSVVRIAADAEQWTNAIVAALEHAVDREQLFDSADAVLAEMSWDDTWGLMKEKMECAIQAKSIPKPRDARAPEALESSVGLCAPTGSAALTTSSSARASRVAFSPSASPGS